MNAPLDFLGREIKIGDTIAYPVRRGSSMWLNKLRVTQVLPVSVKGLNADGRWITVHNLNNVVVDVASRQHSVVN
jgi:expansin (peptidoglycan-binding protein)